MCVCVCVCMYTWVCSCLAASVSATDCATPQLTVTVGGDPVHKPFSMITLTTTNTWYRAPQTVNIINQVHFDSHCQDCNHWSNAVFPGQKGSKLKHYWQSWPHWISLICSHTWMASGSPPWSKLTTLRFTFTKGHRSSVVFCVQEHVHMYSDFHH